MKTMWKMVGVVLLVATGAAVAQEGAPPPPAPTPEQQELIRQQDVQMSGAALQVLQLVDAGSAGEVWVGLSQAVKPLVSQDDFVRQLAADRAQVGNVQSRGEAVVSRFKFEEGGDVPAGLYVSVAFPTRFANMEQPVRELVSFRLDEDQVWRVSGYTLR